MWVYDLLCLVSVAVAVVWVSQPTERWCAVVDERGDRRSPPPEWAAWFREDGDGEQALCLHDLPASSFVYLPDLGSPAPWAVSQTPPSTAGASSRSPVVSWPAVMTS
jgi:hypothetical protein